MLFWGMIHLIVSSLAMFGVPYLIGAVIDLMGKETLDWDNLNFYGLIMLIIIIASGFSAMLRDTLSTAWLKK